jgi:hypothetical protein
MQAHSYNSYKRNVLTEEQYNYYMQLNNAVIVVHDEEALGTWKLHVYDMYNDNNCTLFEGVHFAQCVHTNACVYDEELIQLLADYALCEQLNYTVAQLAHLHKLWDKIPAH